MKKKYILGSINICVLIISLIILIIGLLNINLLPKYKMILLALLSIIVIVLSITAYLSKRITIYNIGIMLTIMLNFVTIYSIYQLNNRYSFFENIMEQKYKYSDYYILVKKNTKYSNVKKIKDKKIGLLTTNKDNVENYINNLVETNIQEYNNKEELINSFENNETQAIIISNKTLKELEKEKKTSNYHKIYTSRIKEGI